MRLIKNVLKAIVILKKSITFATAFENKNKL